MHMCKRESHFVHGARVRKLCEICIGPIDVRPFPINAAAQLYGGNAVNDTSAQVVNVKEGLVKNAFGRQILFETTSCLRLNQSSCFPPSSRLYSYTTHGLDALFNRFYEVLRIDLSDGGLAPWFNSAEFEFVDQTYPDFEGGESIRCYNAHAWHLFEDLAWADTSNCLPAPCSA